MANTIKAIHKYLPDVVDTYLAKKSCTALLENGAKYINLDFNKTGYVEVLDILMDGLSDYYRVNHLGVSGSGAYSHDNSNNLAGARDGYARGSVDATWEIFKLTYNRCKQFVVDDLDNEEQAGATIQVLLDEFLRTKVVPEVDAVRFSKIAGTCSKTLGNLVSETIGANTIISKFNAAIEWLTEHEAGEEGVFFVSPAVMTLIRNTTELQKFISQADFTSERGIKFTLPAYNGFPIVEVPSSRFFTEVVTGANGFYPGANSKIINFILVDRRAVVPVVKVNKSKLWTPETQDDIDGYKLNFRLHHDVIIPKNKVVGAYTSVSNVEGKAKSSSLSLALVSGDIQNAYKVNGVYTTPAGIKGTLVTSQSAFALGTVYEDATTVPTDGSNYVETNASAYFALLDDRGVAVAVSAQITLTGVKHA